MSPFRIKRGKDSDGEIRRVAHERTRDAIERLRDGGADPVVAVHEARKDVKKLRAMLRLVRPSLGEKLYERENARFRAAGLELSAARDTQVRAATIDALAERFADDPPPGGWAEVRAALSADAPAGADLANARETAASAIETGDEAIGDWALGRDDFSLLRPGLERAYSRGREGMGAARRNPTDQTLHDWRKRTKDLWYHLRLVAEAWPTVLDAAAEEAHQLSVASATTTTWSSSAPIWTAIRSGSSQPSSSTSQS